MCRASEPLRSVALSDSINVSIGWISSSIGGFPLRFNESEGIESDMNKVRTY